MCVCVCGVCTCSTYWDYCTTRRPKLKQCLRIIADVAKIHLSTRGRQSTSPWKKSIHKTRSLTSQLHQFLFLCNVPSRHKYGKTGKIVLGAVACQPKKFLPALAKILGTNLRNNVEKNVSYSPRTSIYLEIFSIPFLAHF